LKNHCRLKDSGWKSLKEKKKRINIVLRKKIICMYSKTECAFEISCPETVPKIRFLVLSPNNYTLWYITIHPIIQQAFL
jgi:hypothetical protein